MQWFTYILQCADGSYYIGHTEDVTSRLALHNAGRAAIFTAHRRLVTLVYAEPFLSKTNAIVREKLIKKWSRAKKKALIDGHADKLHGLAKRHHK